MQPLHTGQSDWIPVSWLPLKVVPLKDVPGVTTAPRSKPRKKPGKKARQRARAAVTAATTVAQSNSGRPRAFEARCCLHVEVVPSSPSAGASFASCDVYSDSVPQSTHKNQVMHFDISDGGSDFIVEAFDAFAAGVQPASDDNIFADIDEMYTSACASRVSLGDVLHVSDMLDIFPTAVLIDDQAGLPGMSLVNGGPHVLLHSFEDEYGCDLDVLDPDVSGVCHDTAFVDVPPGGPDDAAGVLAVDLHETFVQGGFACTFVDGTPDMKLAASWLNHGKACGIDCGMDSLD